MQIGDDGGDPEILKRRWAAHGRALQAQENHSQGDKQNWDPSGQQQVLEQAFPPTTLSGIDAKTLLHTWEQKVREDEEAWRVGHREIIKKKEAAGQRSVRGLAPPHAFLVDCMLSIIQKMGDDIQALQDSDVARVMFRSGDLGGDGIVGLLSSDLRQGESDAMDDVSLKALAVFSRGQLECNNKGAPTSLKSILGAQLGIEASAPLVSLGDNDKISLLEIEGLVETELSGRAVSLLLKKIAKWAQIEQKLVTVARNAVFLKDGTDLTAYWYRLGFVEVIMVDGSSRLVYPGSKTSHTDQFVSGRQIMVLLDPWKADF